MGNPDRFTDECAVTGIYGHPQASELTSLSLHMLQHRGQEGSGIISSDGSNFYSHKRAGLVRQIFLPDVLNSLPGMAAIGHNRYSTCGPQTAVNLQPHLVTAKNGTVLAGCSNGDLPGYKELRARLDSAGYQLASENDGEAIVTLIASYLDRGNDMLNAIQRTMEDLEEGAYSYLVLTNNELWAFRDPRGFRPFALGRLGEAYVLASETCAFDLLGASYIRDVFPGQIIRINAQGERSFSYQKDGSRHKPSHCEFEYIYFARPDSVVFGTSVSSVRRKLGAKLYELHPVDADIVADVPDSSTIHALGFSEASGIRFDRAITRHHYALRQFIQPDQKIRDVEAKYKHNPDQAVVKGKRIILVEDSIVRGTTARKLVRMLRIAGAKEIHYRVASPPIISPCFMGIDTPTREELIASSKTIEEIRDFIEADSLAYLTVEAMHDCLPEKDKYCSACFTGKYPIHIPDHKLVSRS